MVALMSNLGDDIPRFGTDALIWVWLMCATSDSLCPATTGGRYDVCELILANRAQHN